MNNIDETGMPIDAHITIDETGMPTDAYITVKRNEKGEVDVYVGGKPATTYYGQPIYGIEFIKEQFAWMQEQNPNIEEFHVGAFATRGKYEAYSDIHSSKFGSNSWCRLKFKNGDTSSWLFHYTFSFAADCANFCAGGCAYHVRYCSGFRAAVFRAPIDKTPQPKTPMENKQQNNDMPTDAYITVSSNGIFVDGKPTTKYRDKRILWIHDIKENFIWLQKKYPQIKALHVISTETSPHNYSDTGKISQHSGHYVYCRIELNTGKISDWVFGGLYHLKILSVLLGAFYCAARIHSDENFCTNILKTVNNCQNKKITHSNNFIQKVRADALQEQR